MVFFCTLAENMGKLKKKKKLITPYTQTQYTSMDGDNNFEVQKASKMFYIYIIQTYYITRHCINF